MARLPLLRLFSLAVRQLKRDARAGELRVLFFALLVLDGTSQARPEQIQSGRELGLEHARIVEFSSVIATDNGIQLSSIKAADEHYPLRGELKNSRAPLRRLVPKPQVAVRRPAKRGSRPG